MLVSHTLLAIGAAIAAPWSNLCSTPENSAGPDPISFSPGGTAGHSPRPPVLDGAIPRPTGAGQVVWGSTDAALVNTGEMIRETGTFVGSPRLVRNMLPEHIKPAPIGEGPANDLVAGATLDEARTIPRDVPDGPGVTGWQPAGPRRSPSARRTWLSP